MIIDAHTHIFPDEQAEAILHNTARLFNVPTCGTATADDLLRKMDSAGISHAVVHMVAPAPGHVEPTNRWLIGLNRERFIKFGTIHPSYALFREEIKRLHQSGIPGIKLQPDVQQFSPSDRDRLYPIYEALCETGMKVMFHVGGEPLPGPFDRSKPHMIAAIAADFPDLTIIAAHLGGLNMWDEVLAHLVGLPNVFMESSLSYSYIKPHTAERIIREHGCSKFFFGTDYPFGDIAASVAAANTVPFLSAAERADILGNNARRFFLETEI